MWVCILDVLLFTWKRKGEKKRGGRRRKNVSESMPCDTVAVGPRLWCVGYDFFWERWM